jgi:hypothetical protein
LDSPELAKLLQLLPASHTTTVLAAPERPEWATVAGCQIRTRRNPQKTGFPESKSEPRFWPGTKAGEYVARRAVRPVLSTNDHQTLNGGMRKVCRRHCWTVALKVREVNSAAGKARSPRKSTETSTFSISRSGAGVARPAIGEGQFPGGCRPPSRKRHKSSAE